MGRKTLFRLAILGGLLLWGSGCGNKSGEVGVVASNPETAEEAPILNLLNWMDYINPALLEQFTKDTGIRVTVTDFGTTEQLEAILQEDHREYDLVIVDDTTLRHYANMRVLLPLNHDWLPNLPNALPLSLDDLENKWSVPYAFGVSLLIYNKEKIPKPPRAWADLWNPNYKGRVVLMEDHWDYLGIGLAKIGQPFQGSDMSRYDEAVNGFESFLRHCGNLSEYQDALKLVASGEMWIGTCYSGDAAKFAQENPQLGYVIPEDGSMRWTDLMAVTRLAKHPRNAHRLINYLLEPKHAAKNANYLTYPTVVRAAEPLLDDSIKSDPMLTLSDAMIAKCPPYPKITPDLMAVHTKLRHLANVRKEALIRARQNAAD